MENRCMPSGAGISYLPISQVNHKDIVPTNTRGNQRGTGDLHDHSLQLQHTERSGKQDPATIPWRYSAGEVQQPRRGENQGLENHHKRTDGELLVWGGQRVGTARARRSSSRYEIRFCFWSLDPEARRFCLPWSEPRSTRQDPRYALLGRTTITSPTWHSPTSKNATNSTTNGWRSWEIGETEDEEEDTLALINNLQIWNFWIKLFCWYRHKISALIRRIDCYFYQ